MAKKKPGSGVRRRTPVTSRTSSTTVSTSSSTGSTDSTSKLKPRLISKDTAESLEMLRQHIVLAEQHLSNMPGAYEPRAKVDVGDLFNGLALILDSPDYFMALRDDSIQIVTATYLGKEDEYDEQDSKRILDYGTRQKVEFAKRIPDLIRAAKEAEGNLKSESDKAITDIQAAIDQSKEYYE